MRKVTCADCGKHYDYDVDDFCPKCGSFNQPPNSGATRLEQELLSRFQGSRAAQPKARPKAQPKDAPKSGPRTPPSGAYHPTYGGGPDLTLGKRHRGRLEDCGACAPEGKKKSPVVKIVTVIVAILVLVNFVLPLIFGLVGQAMLADQWDDQATVEGVIMEEPVWPEAPLADGYVAPWDEFELDGYTLSAGEPWLAYLPEELLDPDGEDYCLAVSFWLWGEGEAISPPVLLLSDGVTGYLPLEDSSLTKTLSDVGLDPIFLSTVDWSQPQDFYGTLLYVVPTSAAGPAELVFTGADGEEVRMAVELPDPDL